MEYFYIQIFQILRTKFCSIGLTSGAVHSSAGQDWRADRPRAARSMFASTPQTRSQPLRKCRAWPYRACARRRRTVLETPIDPRQARRASFHRRRLAQNSATKKPLADGLVFVSKAGNKPSKDG